MQRCKAWLFLRDRFSLPRSLDTGRESNSMHLAMQDKAEQLLDKAGWALYGDTRKKNGEEGKFTLYSLKSDSWTRGVQVVQSQLKDIGIGIGHPDFRVRNAAGEMPGWRSPDGNHGLHLSDPDIVYLWFDRRTSVPGQFSHTDDPDLMHSFPSPGTTMDEDERNAVFEDLQK